MQRWWKLAAGAAGAGVAAFALWRAIALPAALDDAAFAARYATALPPPEGALSIYHLGHSLVGRDMPAMVAQLAGAAGLDGHAWHSQLGWGASLDQHWRDEVPGFEQENGTPAFRPARAALASGDYDAVVLTEMVELRDAIRWHDSARALADWAALARAGRGDARVYLYETWHRLDDPDGWLSRLDADLPRLWEGVLLRQAMARSGVGTIHVIPAGQAMAAVVRAVEAGEIPGLTTRDDLFARTPEGMLDPIHLNDIGAYVVALTHFAVLYGRSPEGLPHALTRADGSPATAPEPEAAAAMQRLVWRAVLGYRPSGMAGQD
ncbi:MAG: hypothetical protein KF887_03805 [Paracoccaceae bacterium]|nr:MAG: hypothetical protein KF887_03805 [Paracoccaceae bacterium]